MNIPRLILRLAIVGTLLWGPATTSTAAPVNDAITPILVCESEPAPDDGEVSIGTALRIARGPGAEDALSDCLDVLAP